MSTFYSLNEYTGDGSTTQYAVNFTLDYINKSDVAVFVDGTPQAFTWISDGLIQLTTAPINGAFILIKRNTDLTSLINDYQNGSVIIEQNLDDSFKQTVLSAQEALDSVSQTIAVDILDGKWQASDRIIKNVKDGVDTQEAVNVGQLTTHDATIVGYKDAAEASAIAASTSEANALSSASTATTQAGVATTKASESLASEVNAANSATGSATSATQSANSATGSAISATQSANSASASATSATASEGSATNASTSASSASTSETNAANSATSSANSATASANSATASANSATASAGSAATAEGYANVLAYNFKPTVNPSIDLDFSQQDYSVYEIPDGINKKPLTDIATVTRAGNASYSDATGMMRTVGTDEPRINYNPDTGVCEGLLVEESRTNLREYSSNLAMSDISTNSGQTEIVSVSEPSVDGSLSAIKVVDTETATAHNIHFLNNLIPDGATYTATIIVEPFGDIESIILTNGFFGNHEVRGDVHFNFNTNSFISENTSVGTAGTIKGHYKSLGKNLYQLSISGAKAVSGGGARTTHLYVGMRRDYNESTYVGDGSSGLIIHNIQIEKGSFPTSYIPDATIFNSRASTATYYDSTGTLQTAAVNEARYSYNPANLRAEPKLLLEKSRTNLVTYSEDLTQSNWSVAGATKTSADTLTTTEGGQAILTSSAISIATGDICGVWEFSKSEFTFGDSLTLTLDDGSTINRGRVVFNVSDFTGIAYSDGSFTDTEVVFRDLGAKFLVGVKTNSPSASIRMRMFSYSTETLGGATKCFSRQLEQGSYPTSYIPTTTTAVTRAADISTGVQATRAADNVVRTLGDEFNRKSYSLYFDFNTPPFKSGNTTNNRQYLFFLNDVGGGAAANSLFVYYFKNQLRIQSGVNASYQDNQVTATHLQANKLVLTYDGYSYKVFLNGVKTTEVVRDLVDFNALQALQINGVRVLNAVCRHHSLFPKALSEQECIALTQ